MNYDNETLSGPSLATVRARQTAVLKRRCCCGSKKDVDPRIRKIGSRTWTVCNRCLGTVKQLS